MNEIHVADAATIEGHNVYLTEDQIIESDGALQLDDDEATDYE